MAIPYLNINSMSYTSSTNVLTVNVNYSYLRGGGSFSITGLPSIIYYGVTNSYALSKSNTYSISLSASTTYNVTFSFYKGPYIKYPLFQPSITGVTGASTYGLGGIPINLGFVPTANLTTLYETSRVYGYSFRT
jgi:hypothetical protein